MSDVFKIGVIDDEPVFRRSLVSLLKREPDLDIVFDRENAESVVEDIAEHEPEGLLMDLSMPRVDGLEALRRIHDSKAEKPVKVILLTICDDPRILIDAIQNCGASGYVTKGEPPETIVRSLRSVLNSKSDRPVVAFGESSRTRITGPTFENVRALTEREASIAHCRIEGLSAEEAAAKLGIKRQTVYRHVDKIKIKLAYSDWQSEYSFEEFLQIYFESLDADL